MKVSKTCLALVQKWEGFYSKAYLDPVGLPTIGYGTTVWDNGRKVKLGETITKERATALLEKQVNEHASSLDQYIKVPLNQNQFDALASFQYNLGKHILKGSSLLNHLNNKDWAKATQTMLQYCKARNPKTGKLQVLKGLENRRKEEVALFLKATEGGDEMEFKDQELKAIYDMRISSKATKELLIATAKRKLNINKQNVAEGDLTAIAYELAVYFAKQNK